MTRFFRTSQDPDLAIRVFTRDGEEERNNLREGCITEPYLSERGGTHPFVREREHSSGLCNNSSHCLG